MWRALSSAHPGAAEVVRQAATAVAMATKVARMTPNGYEDNKNGNNKNNDKGTMMVT